MEPKNFNSDTRPVIRRAVREDCPRLLELNRQLDEFHNAPDMGGITLDDFERNGFGPDPIWEAFVAELDGRIVGFALYFESFSTMKGPRLWLEDMAVEPHLRSHGIGHLFIDRLMEEARSRHLAGLMWHVARWNTGAIEFYKRHDAWLDDQWITCGRDV